MRLLRERRGVGLQHEPGSSISTPLPIPPPQGGRGEPVAGFAPKFGAAFAALADIFLPPVCISCRARVGADGLLCGACFVSIDFIAPPICARLGVPLPYDAGEAALSAAAIARPPVYDRARAAARYSETMRALVQSFKYGDRHEGLKLFGHWLAKAGAELLADTDLIVPVPLYPARLWWRRFNQSAMLAREVARLTGLPAECFSLKRVRPTASQVGLTADQRRRNVRGAFKVDRTRRDRIRGRNVVVMNDVITTGRHGRGLRAGAEAGWRRPGRCAGACARRRSRDLRVVAACGALSLPLMGRESRL